MTFIRDSHKEKLTNQQTAKTLQNGNCLKKLMLLLFSLGFVLYQTVSYAETDTSLSENQSGQIIEQPTPDVSDTSVPEISTQEIQEAKKDSSNFLKSSLLSIKGESGDLPDFVTLSLEFQKSILMKSNRLKWLIQGGIGITDFGSMDKPDSYYHYIIDTGLGYIFPFFNTIVSLKGGLIGLIVPSHKKSDETGVILPRVTFVLGWKISKYIYSDKCFRCHSLSSQCSRRCKSVYQLSIKEMVSGGNVPEEFILT